ncbi:MAG: NFACT family protein [Planctomycetota bacterium]|jgi:predicted ribosome quality control (RQC) complex YloA/Tae2 family protein
MRIPLPDWKLVVEEQQALVGLHIDNVYQVDPKCFLLKLTPGKLSYLIDANPGRARALLTDEPPTIPDRPPMFGSILRRALRGTRVAGIHLLGEDRLLVIELDGSRRLILEAVPNRPNLLLIDAQGTVERVLDGEASKRRGTPIGARYAPPPAPKFRDEESLIPDDLPEAAFAANHHLDGLARGGVSEEKREKEEVRRKKLLDRLQRSRAKADKDLRELPDATALRKQGELLLENFPALTPGMKKFRGVPLDPKHSPSSKT